MDGTLLADALAETHTNTVKLESTFYTQSIVGASVSELTVCQPHNHQRER